MPHRRQSVIKYIGGHLYVKTKNVFRRGKKAQTGRGQEALQRDAQSCQQQQSEWSQWEPNQVPC